MLKTASAWPAQPMRLQAIQYPAAGLCLQEMRDLSSALQENRAIVLRTSSRAQALNP
jgi:hypothetical protein